MADRSRLSFLARIAGVSMLAGVLASCGAGSLQGAVRTPSLEVGSVALPATDGEMVQMRAEDKGLLLVYFGYTSCPDICPTTMSDIRAAIGGLPEELADRVTVAMVTVDPERDSGEVLSRYLDHFFDRSLALRSDDPAQLAEATRAFGVQWQVEEHQQGEPYEVAHTAVTYVVDDAGVVAVEWPFGFDSEAMTSDLNFLLEEQT